MGITECPRKNSVPTISKLPWKNGSEPSKIWKPNLEKLIPMAEDKSCSRNLWIGHSKRISISKMTPSPKLHLHLRKKKLPHLPKKLLPLPKKLQRPKLRLPQLNRYIS